MEKLKPCPFCGNEYIDYYTKPYRKVRGIQHYICVVKCGNREHMGCTAQVSQASLYGVDKAIESAFKYWNRRSK